MIHKIGGNVKLTKAITMAPQQAIKTMGLTQIPVLSKQVNIATAAINNLQDGRVELLSSYESIKPGSQRVAVALYNNTGEKITLKKGTIVAQVATANVIPPCWHLLLVRSRTYPTLVMDWMGMDAKMGMYHPMEGTFPLDHQNRNLPKRD